MVTYIIPGGGFGIHAGYCIMSIKPPQEPTPAPEAFEQTVRSALERFIYYGQTGWRHREKEFADALFADLFPDRPTPEPQEGGPSDA